MVGTRREVGLEIGAARLDAETFAAEREDRHNGRLVAGESFERGDAAAGRPSCAVDDVDSVLGREGPEAGVGAALATRSVRPHVLYNGADCAFGDTVQ